MFAPAVGLLQLQHLEWLHLSPACLERAFESLLSVFARVMASFEIVMLYLPFVLEKSVVAEKPGASVEEMP